MLCEDNDTSSLAHKIVKNFSILAIQDTKCYCVFNIKTLVHSNEGCPHKLNFLNNQ